MIKLVTRATNGLVTVSEFATEEAAKATAQWLSKVSDCSVLLLADSRTEGQWMPGKIIYDSSEAARPVVDQGAK